MLIKARFSVDEDVLSITEPMTITFPCDRGHRPWEVQVAMSQFIFVIMPCPSLKDMSPPGLTVTLIVSMFVRGTTSP